MIAFVELERRLYLYQRLSPTYFLLVTGDPIARKPLDVKAYDARTCRSAEVRKSERTSLLAMLQQNELDSMRPASRCSPRLPATIGNA